MKSVIKNLKFEIKKVFSSKSTLIIILIVFLLIGAFISFATSAFLPRLDIVDKEIEFKQYEFFRDQNKFYYDLIISGDFKDANYGLPCGEFDKDYYYSEYLKYDYLIKTQTFDIDYARIDRPNSSYRNVSNGVFLLNLGTASFFILGIFAIFLAFYIYQYDSITGAIKHMVAAPIRRKNIFYSKVFISFFTLLILALLILIVALIANRGVSSLVFDGKSVYAVKCLYLFFGKLFLSLFVSFFVFLFTVAIMELTKKWLIGILAPFAFYAIFFVAHSITYNSIDAYEPFFINKYFLFYNAQNLRVDMSALEFWLIFASYAVLSLLLLFIAKLKFVKKDF